MTEELKPSATPIQATLVPVKVWIEKDMMGTVHIKRQNEGGPAFDFIQIQYSHMHTCNAHQHGLAEQIVALLNGAALTAAQPAQAGDREAWVPYLVDRADGVKGHYAIGRWNPRGYREVWNLHSHRWAAYSDDVMSLEEADSLLRQITIPTARASLPAQPAAQATPEPKPFAAPGRWFPVDVLGNPMREFEPGKWEAASWPSAATPEPVGEPDTVPLDALLAAERERDYWKTRARAMLDHAEGTCWYWMGDGEDHLESLVNSLPVVIRADQLRELLARPAPGVPEGFDVQAHVATGGGHEYPLITVRDTSTQVGEDVFPDEHPVIYGLLSALLAAAQAKGGEHD